MRSLLAATCLTPVALLSTTGQLFAETVVSTSVTTPYRTSIAANGARDDVRVASNGAVKPVSGVAITLDSNNTVKNEGTIQITDANDATGILATPGVSGSITNSGKIIIDESYTPADADKDGDNDGPLAQGARRFGIRIAPGGTFTGSITSSGEITVEGNDSAGIAIDSALAGSLNNSGAISVTGDRSYGIRAGDVSGDVTLRGAISVRGAESVGAALDGDIGGKLVIQSGITSTGYRTSAPPSDTSKLDTDDLLQGGPALRIAGNVTGGILFDVAPADKDPKDADEDKDGIPDASEGAAAISSIGAAPAVLIGSTTEDIAIGAVAGNASGHGIVMKGAISGAGTYKDVAANGMVIGGLGGAVNIAGGMTVEGSIIATSTGANATALRIGNEASVATIAVSGRVEAAGGSVATSNVAAVAIDAGANVGKITNSGLVRATRTGADGTAVAIVDRSGTLALIENTGAITVAGPAADSGKAIAIDLSTNTAGATVRQTVVTGAGPTITGNILFGSGADVLDIADGSVTGTTRFGAGANRLNLAGDSTYAGNVVFGADADTVTLAGTASQAGSIDFGGGADALSISGTASFTGTLSGANGLAVNVASGSLNLTGTGAAAIASLNVGATGAIGVNIDGATGAHTTYQVIGNASFAQGSKVLVRMSSLGAAEGQYVIVRAGSLTGAANLTSADTVLPYIFASTLSADTNAGQISLNVRRKNATELGLNRSETAAYDAIYAALRADKPLGDTFLTIADGDNFRGQLRQMLPEHAGGIFETVTQGSRATARLLADPKGPFKAEDGWRFWIQQVAWGTSKNLGDTAAYDVTGWGISGGAEIVTESVGNFGFSLAYLNGKDADGETANEVLSGQYEAAAYWRGQWGALRAHARASAAYVDLSGSRFFKAGDGASAVSRAAAGEWNGMLYSASGGASYEIKLGRLSLRPTGSLDYYRLKEDGYTETGGGTGFNLIVDDRTSDEFAASGTLALAYDFGGKAVDSGWFRAEIEGGRRQLIGGALGATTAHFAGGQEFALLAEERESGWIGALRLIGGNAGFRLGGEFNAEEQQGRAAVAFRASLQIGL
ncbi:autotransporter outer membrane beta-barrel domain-containing protein [Sphingomonas cavernae]|uniref:Autotransporter domain-containing protein n=1 Tax=Sphingomonas cavernae TaxID=2320861 RepID=A0A418WNZ3_9SPHN|nr:autotransporter outer membrane beta-barrel domain-containing protein [Sphingomonas cavernae]RJF92952.1 autotransporter domain-containing protein [Sphingomonas cavernae]